MEKIIINTKKKKKFEMDLDTFVRWGCLIEAIETIDKHVTKQEARGIKCKNWIKPCAIQKFINERYGSLKNDVLADIAAGDFDTKDEQYK